MGSTAGGAAPRRQWTIAVGDHAAASRARREFAEELRRIPWREVDLEGAEIVFGELVHNAVRHAKVQVTVELRVNPQVTLYVRDDGPCFWIDRYLNPRPDAESGRGLMIARAMGRGLWVERLDHSGCVVVATLPASIGSGRERPPPEYAGNDMH